jgi:Zn-dependent peptidase ImmA (M78 family)
MTILAARRRAETLVQRLGLVEPPVDVVAIAQSLGIQVVTTNLGDDISGLLITRDGATTICIEKSHHIRRRRFTLAHEIGHFYLRHQFEPGEHVHVDRGTFVSKRSGRSSEGTDAKEVEANQFAACLLMPRLFVEQEIERVGGVLTDETIAALADKFIVSAQAMTIRLGTLGWL